MNNEFNVYENNANFLRNQVYLNSDQYSYSEDSFPQNSLDTDPYYFHSNQLPYYEPHNPPMFQNDDYANYFSGNFFLTNSVHPDQHFSHCESNINTNNKYLFYEEPRVNTIDFKTFDYNHSDNTCEYDRYYESHQLQVDSKSLGNVNKNWTIQKSLSDLNQMEVSKLERVSNQFVTDYEEKIIIDEMTHNEDKWVSSLINSSQDKEYPFDKTQFQNQNTSAYHAKKSCVFNTAQQNNGLFMNHPSAPRNGYFNPIIKKKKKKNLISPYCMPLVASTKCCNIETTNTVDKPKKGIPAWIIDDINKLRKKEIENNIASEINDAHDNDSDRIVDMSPSSSKETKIDLTKVYNNSDTFNDVDITSKTMIELIDLLDERIIEEIKVTFMLSALTDIMKDVTSVMISETVISVFSRILIGDEKKKTKKAKHDSTTKTGQASIISQSLGLDVYESDDSDASEYSDNKSDQDSISGSQSDDESENSTSVNKSESMQGSESDGDSGSIEDQCSNPTSNNKTKMKSEPNESNVNLNSTQSCWKKRKRDTT